MSELDRLGKRFNCDKASQGRKRGIFGSRGRGHDYLRKYEFFLERFRVKPDFKLLELGIGPDWNMGSSLKMWKTYFQTGKKQITMADSNPNAEKFSDDQAEIKIGDLGEPKFIEELSASSYDVIIDDASHIWVHQINCFLELFPSLNEGGVYIIEDIHTSFGDLRERYGEKNEKDAFEFFWHLTTQITGDGSPHPSMENRKYVDMYKTLRMKIESIAFVKHAVIICKRGYFS